MKKEKTNKGITLIALIITIIIMLILALVSISIIKNQSLISKSQEAVDSYHQKAGEEQDKLTEWEKLIAQYSGSSEEAYVTPRTEITYKGQTLKVGDYVNYDEGTGYEWTTDSTKGTGGDSSLTTKTYTTEDMSWRVLGLDANGNLELISDKQTSERLYLKGKAAREEDEEGKVNGEEQLNEMCDSLYGKGEKAESARSVNAEDINAILGYNKRGFKIEEKEDDNNWVKWTYGYKVTYSSNKSTWNPEDTFKVDGKYEYNYDKGDTFFTNIDGTEATDEKTITIESNAYFYTRDEITKRVNSNILDMVFGEKSHNSFWLASRCVEAYSGGTSWGLFVISDDGLYDGDGLYYTYLYDSNGFNDSSDRYVRPVVSLKSDVQLSGSSETSWTIN